MIENAKITGTMFGKEDHGIFTCAICVEGSCWGCWYGNYALDTFDKEKGKRVATAEGLQSVMELLSTLEVNQWEELEGQYIRVKTEKQKIVAVGHLIKDKWFSFEEFFNGEKEQ